MSSAVLIFWILVAILVFALPGWALTRRIGSPAPVLTAFLGSAAVLFNVVLALDLLRVPLRTETVGAGLVVAAVAVLSWRGLSGDRVHVAGNASFTRNEWPWIIPPALALLSIAGRAMVDPLSGYDNAFRWDYLARLVLSQGSLAGYPPVSAADYQTYAWCDGIPPLIPLINFWIYAATGCTASSVTAVRVIAEALLLGTAVYRFADLIWEGRGGRFGPAALSASALAIWSVAMGQETAISAIGLVAMLYCLELHARHPHGSYVFWAAVAGGVAAISRDYAAITPVLGLVLLVARDRRLQPGLLFAAVATTISAPWYIRNWVITGNPLFPQPLGGLFPGIPIFDELMRNVARYWSLRTSPMDPAIIPPILLALAGATTVVGLLGFVIGRKRIASILAGVGLSGLLWVYMLSHSGGGWTYASRVLLPTLALFAVGAGWIASARKRTQSLLLIAFTVASADAARRAWLLPSAALDPVWPYSFSAWRESRVVLDQINSHRVWAILAAVAGESSIVVDHPSYHRFVGANGGHPVPLFSPILKPTFAADPAFDEVLAHLHREHIRFVVLSRGSYMGEEMVDAHPFWRELRRRYRPNSVVGILLIYDLMNPQTVGR